MDHKFNLNVNKISEEGKVSHNPLELIETVPEQQYGQFIDLRNGESFEICLPLVMEHYRISCAHLATKGLFPVGDLQIINHTAEQNKDGYGPYPTTGWKQRFERKQS